MVEEANGLGGAGELPERQRLGDVGPAPVAIGRVAADQQEGPGGAEGQDLSMIQAEAGAPDRRTEVPRRVPVRVTHADSPLAGYCGADPLIKRGQVEDFLRPQRMTDRADPARV